MASKEVEEWLLGTTSYDPVDMFYKQVALRELLEGLATAWMEEVTGCAAAGLSAEAWARSLQLEIAETLVDQVTRAMWRALLTTPTGIYWYPGRIAYVGNLAGKGEALRLEAKGVQGQATGYGGQVRLNERGEGTPGASTVIRQSSSGLPIEGRHRNRGRDGGHLPVIGGVQGLPVQHTGGGGGGEPEGARGVPWKRRGLGGEECSGTKLAARLYLYLDPSGPHMLNVPVVRLDSNKIFYAGAQKCSVKEVHRGLRRAWVKGED